MKLFEIFQGDDINPHQYDSDNQDIRDVVRDQKKVNDPIESGRMAHVTSVRDSEHEVLKHMDHHDRAYEAYAKLAMKMSASNPYFPRIRSSQSGEFFLMEKLIHMYEAQEEEMIAVGKKMFNNFMDDLESKMMTSSEQLAAHVEYLFDKALGSLMRQGNDSIVKDPLLLEAIHLIQQLMYKNDFNNDVTFTNLMFRRTRYGLQLVITDPISD